MRHVMFLVLMSMIFTACTKGIGLKTIKDNRTEWEAVNTGDYEYLFNSSCMCVQSAFTPARIIVRADTIHRIEDPTSGDLLVNTWNSTIVQETHKNYFYTIDGLYDYLEESGRPHEREVEFDPTFHFPSIIGIDYIKNAVDDEIYFTVTEFQFL